MLNLAELSYQSTLKWAEFAERVYVTIEEKKPQASQNQANTLRFNVGDQIALYAHLLYNNESSLFLLCFVQCRDLLFMCFQKYEIPSFQNQFSVLLLRL